MSGSDKIVLCGQRGIVKVGSRDFISSVFVLTLCLCVVCHITGC